MTRDVLVTVESEKSFAHSEILEMLLQLKKKGIQQNVYEKLRLGSRNLSIDMILQYSVTQAFP